MSFARQVSRLLDEEHRASLALLGQLEAALMSGRMAELQPLSGPLQRLLEQETSAHFDFEEQQLFPRMEEAGDTMIAALLREEHDTIREVAAELLPLARGWSTGMPGNEERQEARRIGMELVERMASHIQKETMGLLPLLDDLLDEDTDRELVLTYTSG